MRNFNKWLETCTDNIYNYEYYVDFEKVYVNLNIYKEQLNMINFLIGSKNIEKDFKKLVSKYPNVLECIPILLAVRNKEIKILDEDEKQLIYNFKEQNYDIEQYCTFMRKTGLFNLFEEHLINNTYDYVTGVETGLDSNARKNRSGDLMEDIVEKYLTKLGLEKNKTYFKEIKTKEIENKWGIDMSYLTNNGKTIKKFDFAVKTEKYLYVIETNFYGSTGSKLIETARSYKMLEKEIEEIENVKFIWITDGQGWRKTKNNLEETFDIMDDVYNINDMKNNIFKKIIV